MPELPKFWITSKKCIIWTNYFYYFSFHVRRNCQDEDSNTMLMKLAWLKRSACPQCRIDQLTITKNGDGVRFCLQGFSCRKKAKKNCHSNLALESGGFIPLFGKCWLGRNYFSDLFTEGQIWYWKLFRFGQRRFF